MYHQQQSTKSQLTQALTDNAALQQSADTLAVGLQDANVERFALKAEGETLALQVQTVELQKAALATRNQDLNHQLTQLLEDAQMNKRKHGVWLACLTMLCACTTTPPAVRYVPIYKTQYVLPPEVLMRECNVTQVPLQVLQCLQTQKEQCLSNPKSAGLMLSLLTDLGQCNLDWQALHDWRQRHQTDQTK